jgi:hypothetical protein
MSVSVIQMPWSGVTARPHPDAAPVRVADLKPVIVVQPIPDNPTAQPQPHWAGYPQKALSVAGPATPGTPQNALPDLFFPDPLPELPKIDMPAPKTAYPAALDILGGSAKGKLG